jgi:hypothetical protein
MIKKCLIERDLEGSGSNIEALYQYLPGGAKESHEKLSRIS